LLASDVTKFVLVASPRTDTVDEARFFAARLHDKQLGVAAVVVNRCTPEFGAIDTSRPRSGSARLLFDNLAELRATAEAERVNVASLMADSAVGEQTTLKFVPVQGDDVHDLTGLDRLRALLFA
jgi:anion-transporting  ArsA/GET3 family ATPase